MNAINRNNEHEQKHQEHQQTVELRRCVVAGVVCTFCGVYAVAAQYRNHRREDIEWQCRDCGPLVHSE